MKFLNYYNYVVKYELILCGRLCGEKVSVFIVLLLFFFFLYQWVVLIGWILNWLLKFLIVIFF